MAETAEKPNPEQPSIGRIVHYVPEVSEKFTKVTKKLNMAIPTFFHHAAIITAVWEVYKSPVRRRGIQEVSLRVFSPTGEYVVPNARYSERAEVGTYHWPERV